jgi:hypothetical protein
LQSRIPEPLSNPTTRTTLQVSILTIAGIPSASTAANLDFQGLTKHEPLFIHIVHVFWTRIELSNKLSQLQYQLLVKNIEVYESNVLCEKSVS